MRMRTVYLVGFAVVAVGAFTLPPYLRRAGILTPRWEALDGGPAKGIAWMRLSDGKPLPSGIDRPASWVTDSSSPNDFVFQTPTAGSAEAFLLVGGKEVPIELNGTFHDQRFHSVQPVREYPPGLDSLDLVIKSPGQSHTRFRMHDLPPTSFRFPTNVRPLPSTSIDGVVIEASAWTEPPADGLMPYVAAAVRARGRARENEAWRIQGFEFHTPFRGASAPESPSISIQSLAFRDETTIGTAVGHPWASAMPNLQVVGHLDRLGVVEDEFDFGTFEVVRPDPAYPTHYALRMSKPVDAVSKGGFRVRLETVREVQPDKTAKDGRLNLRLVVDPATLPAGLTAAMLASKNEREVAVRYTDRFPHQSLSMAPTAEGSTNAVFGQLDIQAGQKIRLKLSFVRRVVLDESPFILYPSVTHRSGPVKSLRGWKPDLSTRSGCFIQPDPEDFPTSLTAHN